MIRKCTFSLIAALLTTPALAAEPAGDNDGLPRQVAVEARIDIGDIDPSNPAALAALDRRVSRAIDDMCRPVSVPAGLGDGRVDGNCARRARTAARAQIADAIAARTSGSQTAMNTSHPSARRTVLVLSPR